MKILLVDDDILLANSLALALNHMNYQTTCKYSGNDAEHALAHNTFNLLILDIGLPDKSGFEVLSHLRSQGNQTPVLILTGENDPEHQQRGLDLGADDFMVKPFQLHELQSRIRLLAQPHHLNKSALWELGLLSFDHMGRVAYLNQEVLPLSPTELSVLEILLRRAERLVSTDEVLNHLKEWGNESSGHIIHECVLNIRNKINGCGIVISELPNLGYCLQQNKEKLA